MTSRNTYPNRRRITVTLDELETLGIELADADAESEAAYLAARRKLWRTFVRAVAARARELERRRLAQSKHPERAA